MQSRPRKAKGSGPRREPGHGVGKLGCTYMSLNIVISVI